MSKQNKQTYMIHSLHELERLIQEKHSDGTEATFSKDHLISSLALLRATLESTADGILVVDKNGKVTGFNQRFLELWKIPDELAEKGDDDQLLGFVISQLSDPDAFISKVRELYDTPEATSLDIIIFKDARVFERYSQPQRMGDELIGRVWSFRDISERSRLEKSIHESEQRFRAITEHGHDITIILNSEGKITYVSPSIERAIGRKAQELLGQTPDKFMHPADLPLLSEAIIRAINETGSPQRIESCRVRHANGHWVFLQAQMIGMPDVPGVEGVVVTARDVSRTHRVEHAITRIIADSSADTGSDFFKNMVVQLGDALEAHVTLIGRLDVSVRPRIRTVGLCIDGEIVENFEYDLEGTPCQNVVGIKSCTFSENVASLFPDDKLLKEMAIEGYVGVPLYDSQRQPLGIMVALFKTPLADPNFVESILQIFSQRTSAEIERTTAESELAMFKTIADRASYGVVITDLIGNVKYVNESLATMHGYKLDELQGINVRQFHTDEQWILTEQIGNQIIAGEINCPVELWHKHKDGTTFPTLMSGVLLQTGDDSSPSWATTVLDISEMHRLQEFSERAERLETAGRIAGQVAHDFNNLLGPLIAYPELIREDLPEDHPTINLLKDMENAAEQMAEINQQLLTLGRRGHYNMEALDLNAVVEQVLRQSVTVSESINIETDLADDLKLMKGGASQIVRVISNLITNAIDAMQSVGELRIKTLNWYVTAPAGKYIQLPIGEYVKLVVTDTGSGIPQELLSRIFEPFFTTKAMDKQSGSGLGLSVVHTVVKDHDGYVDVTSEIGQGTSFYLYFPVTGESVNKPDVSQITGGSESVLVVEDDPIQQDVTVRILSRLGYKVATANSGETAIECLKDMKCDLLILDMILPGGIDGAETYLIAKEMLPDIKAILISGFTENEQVQKAQSLGAGSFVKKPLTLNVLAQAIRQELDSTVATSVKTH